MALQREIKRLALLDVYRPQDAYKTGLMFKIEKKLGADIFDILARPIKSKDMAVELGVSEAAISQWRKKFNLVFRDGKVWVRSEYDHRKADSSKTRLEGIYGRQQQS